MQESDSAERRLFPLSISQKNIWNLEQVLKGTSINNICSTIHISGRVELAVIQKTLNLVIAADPSLRTRLVLRDGEPMQFHEGFEPEQFPVFDFSLTDREGISHWEAAVTHEAMPLLEQPLFWFAVFKLGETDGGILMKTHHMISDGWSQVLLGNRISETYLALLAGKEPKFEVLESYEDHVRREQEYLTSRAFMRDESFWREKMARFTEPCALKECKSAAVSPVGQRKSFPLSEVLNHAIQSFCAENRVGPFAVFYMALAVYLRRVSGLDRLGIGVPIFNRVNFKEKNTTGMFVSTLPFLNDLDENWSFLEFNEHLNEQWFHLLRHQKYPFTEIVRLAKDRQPDTDHLFHIVLSYQNSKLFETKDATAYFTGRWHYSGYQSEHLVIHLSSLEFENRFSVDYDYLTQIFSAEEIDSLHSYLVRILREALLHPKLPIWRLPILSGEEEEKVLFSFNRTDTPLPVKTISKQLGLVAAEHPHKIALISKGERMSYQALWERSQNAAAAIEAVCPGGGHVIAVSLPKSFGLLEGMLGAALSGNAWVVIADGLPENRKLEILADSGASLFIGETVLNGLEIPSLSCGQLRAGAAASPLEREVSPRDLAYLVYTSGSTGKPKGVEIEQESLLNFAMGMAPLYGYGGVLSLCNTGFDVFVLESVASLLNGRTVILADEAEQENPEALARLIQNYAVGVIALTPSRLKAYMGNRAFREAMKRLESVVLGGEQVPGELIKEIKLYSPARIYNQYGPSEAAVGVSYQRLNEEPAVTIGSPMPNCRLYVLDGHLQPMPIGVYGDLYIGGLCVGRGYRNAPKLTEESFLKSPFEQGERLYKTGDIACWNPKGQLVLGGRRDGQIKLRGLRIEPQEIAMRIMSHPGVETAAVKMIGTGGHGYLGAYYVSKRHIPETELLSYLATCLPDYMIPAYLQRIESLPFDANGKIDCRRLPEPAAKTEGGQPQNETQKKLLKIFQSVLHNEEMNVESDYFLSGGDSLNAMETLCAVERELHVSLKIMDLYAFRTVLRLEQRVCGGNKAAAQELSEYREIGPAPYLPLYPLSPSQRSLYVGARLDPSGIAYNMPGAFRLGKTPDFARLEAALQKLVDQEELLRTSFVLENGRIGQKVLDRARLSVPVIEADDLTDASASFIKPFAFEEPPLLRAAFWREPEGVWHLLIDMPHIVSDGISTPILMERLDAFYRGEALKTNPIFFKDYAYWLENEGKENREEQKRYWQSRMKDFPGLLELPADRQRPKTFDFKGETLDFSLDAKTAALAEEFCQSHELTPFMLFAAAYGVLLGKFAGTEDVTFGTPVSGRGKRELWSVLGPFLNTLPLRLSPKGERRVCDYLEEAKAGVLQLLDHQDVFLEEILALTGEKRTVSGNVFYNALFSFRPMGEDAFVLDGRELDCIPLKTGAAKMDLNLEAYQTKEGYSFRLEYASSVYYRDSMELLSRCYRAVIHELMTKEEETIGALAAISPKDRLELWERPNRLRTPYLNQCIDQMIDETALLLPDAPAIRFHGKIVTYEELKKRSDALAGQLQRAGARKGDVIALAGRRDAGLAAGMLGILKAGCAYVPVLASFPEARLRSMLELSGAKLLLCDGCTYPELPKNLPCPAFVMTEELTPFSPVAGRSADDDIHILFTSGTTGEPKGAKLPHRAIMNLLTNVERMFEGVEGDILCASGVIFDTFITETLLAFAMGKCCVMADEEEMLLPWKLAELIQENHVEILQLTPSRLQMCLGCEEFKASLRNIRVLFSCGEVLTRQLLDSLKAAGAEKVFNLYGPTETAVYITGIDMTHREKIVVGKAFTNCRLYVLDENLRPVMPMARGELYIAGECLSRGYVNRRDLTEASYLPDPFFPGETMYRSGDIVRMMPDRGVEFVGRRDLQVKLNGQRIELEEITGQIIRSGLVGEAAVIAMRKPDFSMELRAFVTSKAGSPVDIPEIKGYLADQLPSYMIPSSFIELNEIPKTATGKNDRRALAGFSALQAPGPEQNREKPKAQCLEEQAEEIWKQALNRTELSWDTPFFDQGGTSLAALAVLSRYFQQGWSLTLAQFYENPTLNGQLPLLRQNSNEPNERFDETSRSACATGLEGGPRDCGAAPSHGVKPADQNAVLVTGATGYLGAHLVKELISAGEEQIICLVRGDRKRLFDCLAFYFGGAWVLNQRDKITAVRGDIRKEFLGMEGPQYRAAAAQCGQVIHAAADVSHYGDSNESMRTNADGTDNVIAFAREADAELMYISTMSVSGEYLKKAPGESAVFTEQDFDIGQNWQDNMYVRGKFLGELQVMKAVQEGLRAKIFRVGRLVGRGEDGMFQRNPGTNAFYRFLRGALCLELVPVGALNLPLELTPVDGCAKAVVLLRSSGLRVFHVFYPETVTLRALLESLNHPAKPVGDAAFEDYLKIKLASGMERELASFTEAWNQFKTIPQRIYPTAEDTVLELKRLGFAWGPYETGVLLKQFLQ